MFKKAIFHTVISKNVINSTHENHRNEAPEKQVYSDEKINIGLYPFIDKLLQSF